MCRKNRPFYRLAAADSRASRDGRTLEILGTYDPHQEEDDKKIVVNRERVIHWLNKGAKPTESVASLLKKTGIHA